MPSKPLLIFDGACGFCRRWIERWRQKTGDRIDYAPSQEAAGRFPEIPKEEFDRSVVLVEPNGAITTGAEAALKALALGSRRGPGDGGRILYWFYRRLPGFKTIAEKFYSFIASHRMAASRISNLLWGKNLEPSTYRCSIWIFLRLLGLTYLIAFLSLAVQIRGLVGKNGILPIAPLVDLVKERLGPWGILDFPTLCWFQAGDPFLLFLCLGGAALSLLVLFGFLQGPLLLILWIFYLSLATAGQVFLQFQWDNLLLEAGFIALCAAPWKVWAGKPATLCLSRPARWLFWFLLFKLTFSSGLVKLASGDETWQNLTALNFHYETQPLPTWIGWHVHQLPEWFQKVSVVFMFFVELVVPFFIFMPRRIRHGGAFLIMALQGLIALTGNYGFFNLLTIALCLTILDDVFWKRPAIAPLSPLSFSPQKTAALVFPASPSARSIATAFLPS
ncbi:MAG: lipase maturation factor family protein [Deltaproteobacteria bacterium]|nr:lipase maturation factor family protein [Deltaproteobacteria bacterium]